LRVHPESEGKRLRVRLGILDYFHHMATREDLLIQLRKLKAELFARYPIARLALFGSYARNEQSEHSDCDLLVEFNAPVGMEFIRLAYELEDLLGMRVDLVSRGGVKPQYFAAIEPDLIDV
jgi:predicted nucleotidyltransferase